MFGGRIRSGLLMFGLAVATGCAHGGGPAAPKADVKDNSIYVAPRIINAQSVMRLETRSSTPFRGTVDIPVSADGRPDIFGMRSSRTMDSTMKRSLEEWLQGVTFVPATRDGVPVRGIYTMTFR